MKLGVILYWKYNQEYFAENFCENKYKPEITCAGKCYLDKQLLKIDNQEKNDKQNTASNLLKVIETDAFVLFSINIREPEDQKYPFSRTLYPSLVDFYSNQFISKCYQPPDFLVA